MAASLAAHRIRAVRRAGLPARVRTTVRYLSTQQHDDGFPGGDFIGLNYHQADPWTAPEMVDRGSNAVDMSAVGKRHWDEHWDDTSIREAQGKHAMATWTPSSLLDAAPIFDKAEGCYVYTSDGRKLLDWTSQAICTNLGHTVPPAVTAAIVKQLDACPHIYGGTGIVESRVRLASLLSEILPPSLTGFLFPSSGGEANEAAIRMARRFTGRHKILSQYRSYHGGTTTTLAATGDFRRLVGLLPDAWRLPQGAWPAPSPFPRTS
jgi:4-aminobutyrate aminotransferase-like enzyme